jgi:hypothetical protein
MRNTKYKIVPRNRRWVIYAKEAPSKTWLPCCWAGRQLVYATAREAEWALKLLRAGRHPMLQEEQDNFPGLGPKHNHNKTKSGVSGLAAETGPGSGIQTKRKRNE